MISLNFLSLMTAIMSSCFAFPMASIVCKKPLAPATVAKDEGCNCFLIFGIKFLTWKSLQTNKKSKNDQV